MKNFIFLIYLSLFAAIAQAKLPMPPEWQHINSFQGASLDIDGYSADIIKDKLFFVYRLKYIHEQKSDNLPGYDEKRYGLLVDCENKTIKNDKEFWYLKDELVQSVDMEKAYLIPQSDSAEFLLVNHVYKGK
jgi:hypothetical protein